MSQIQDAMDRNWKALKTIPNVLNVGMGTKFQGGKDTGQTCIVVYVSQKLPLAKLSASDMVPKEVEGFLTDVMELRPKTWVAGKTSMSELPPSKQKRRLGLVRKK